MNNVSPLTDCYGCGVCAMACPKHIISMRLNADGFYHPIIEESNSCINCGICLDVCAYSHETLSVDYAPLASYAAWSKDPAVRRKCSSGGVGFEIAKDLLGNGFEVCGVRYNAERNRAEHYVATTVEELIPSIGSKYIQSYTLDSFKQIDRHGKYLITGTPCQMDSFRRYIQRHKILEGHFVLMDFFCHGVPSKWLWDKYLSLVERITGKVVYASWRNKFSGWHDSWALAIDGEERGEKVNWHDSYNILIREKKCYYNSKLSEGDSFYTLFLSNCCLGKACYEHCKYKCNHSAADIRIGDLWGTKYSKDENGVSVAIAFTSKGQDILLHSLCTLVKEPLDVAIEGQIKNKLQMPSIRSKVLSMLCDESIGLDKIQGIVQRYNRLRKLKFYFSHPLYVMNRLKSKLAKR